MNILRYPEKEKWSALLQRPRLNHATLEDQVQKIIDEVAAQGDQAVLAYTKKHDGIVPDAIETCH